MSTGLRLKSPAAHPNTHPSSSFSSAVTITPSNIPSSGGGGSVYDASRMIDGPSKNGSFVRKFYRTVNSIKKTAIIIVPQYAFTDTYAGLHSAVFFVTQESGAPIDRCK
jgi:hypothetical protein